MLYKNLCGMRFTEIENNNIGGASRRETDGTRERKGVPHKTLPRNPPSRYFARQSVGRLMFFVNWFMVIEVD